MRTFIAVIVTAVFTTSVSVGLTHSIMQAHECRTVDRVTVSAFNDGFTDGACHQGTDGFGHPCK